MNVASTVKGTGKNIHEASIITSYIITHNDTKEVMQMIGSDDASLRRQKARMEVMLQPPTKGEKSCTPGHQTPGGVLVPPKCVTVSVVDHDALKKKLDQVEGSN